MTPLRLRIPSLRAPTTPLHRLTGLLPSQQHQSQCQPREQPLLTSTTITARHQSSSVPSSTSSSECQQDIQANRSAQQDRTRISRQPSEYSKSGTDDAVAAQAVSFSPDSAATADPAKSIAQAAEQMQIQNLTGGAATTRTSSHNNNTSSPTPSAQFNPLEVSPANVEISSTTSEIEGAATVQGDAIPHASSQSRTYVGTTTQKSKSTTTTATATTTNATDAPPRKKVFAGTDTRKDAMPGGGRGPIIRPGAR
ncbi:hypothetical protein AYL99_01128 [Fonsecaea erecta]|uniref:Uncharacterized protein n=1 Tax=Fonsecaea erecta TaxID=1367422 RepID=A0A179A0L9_9EURO|nr:hypothetical protein AYL99_01128 [Fonsecaea erecta]OAP65156.1 hypothetical protein AYL99_01128 [Fonsecaea erecta]